MDPKAAIRNIVDLASKMREDSYEGRHYAAELAFQLAENCEALWTWVIRQGGNLPGGVMPWDGQNEGRVHQLFQLVYAHWDAEHDIAVIANGVRLADLVTMTDTDHIV